MARSCSSAQNSIPATIATELNRLKPAKIVILGGSNVVSNGVLSSLGGFTAGTVTRLSGHDRYGTAAAISAGDVRPQRAGRLHRDGPELPGRPRRRPGRGCRQWPDPARHPNSIPATIATELTRLKPHRIVILGGSNVGLERRGGAARPLPGAVASNQHSGVWPGAAETASADAGAVSLMGSLPWAVARERCPPTARTVRSPVSRAGRRSPASWSRQGRARCARGGPDRRRRGRSRRQASRHARAPVRAPPKDRT